MSTTEIKTILKFLIVRLTYTIVLFRGSFGKSGLKCTGHCEKNRERCCKPSVAESNLTACHAILVCLTRKGRIAQPSVSSTSLSIGDQRVVGYRILLGPDHVKFLHTNFNSLIALFIRKS